MHRFLPLASPSPRPVVLSATALAVALFFGAPLRLPGESPQPQVERLKSSPVLRHLVPNPAPASRGSPAEATLAQMYAPPGFRVSLIAAEPEVRQPVAFAIDERGRLWVAEAFSYPNRRPAGQGLDRLIILEDRDGDGAFETRKVFAEGLNLVSGLEVGFGGVWVGAAPELLFIPDRNHDDVPDGPPQVLLEGFGYQDTHECLNSFLWGPDGWLYGIQGVFNYARIGKPGAPDAARQELRAGVWRYHPVRQEFEIFAHGGSNPWGIDYDERGQLFMTHCRSYWGRGGTTHVIQGGQFWNQANANYAPYIIAEPPAAFPDFQNFLLASARYDHGAGGAGKPGSDAIYGGHSHVGTMIYLGDNWPDQYRGHLFTHNLHGHQINQQVNRRWGSGFDTVHAGLDHFFCSDPKYVALDLQYGPDGAVYINDWYDQQHCHNPNDERWDRGNGRLYRLEYAATYQPKKVDLRAKSDAELLALVDHKNAWYGRTARRLLQERAATQPLAGAALASLQTRVTQAPAATVRLAALWNLHAAGATTDTLLQQTLQDPDEYVRAWAIQLGAESRQPSSALAQSWARLAQEDPSPVVRLYLASASTRLTDAQAWPILVALAAHGEDLEDRNLPKLLWQSLAPRLSGRMADAFRLAETTLLPPLADWIHWYAATQEGEALNESVRRIAGLEGEPLRRRLAGLWLAMEPRANVPMPAAWKELAPRLYAHADEEVRRATERLAATFGDASSFPRLRTRLADRQAPEPARRHAFSVLARAQDRESLPVFLQLLDEPGFRTPALNQLSRFDTPAVSSALLERFETFNPSERTAALAALTSRPSSALALLDAVANGRFKRENVTAFQVRQLAALKNAEIDRRVAEHWGRIQQSPAEKQAVMAKLEHTFNEAPLWAFDGRAGREHFLKLCASCHVLGQDGTRVGPELSGAGKNGIRYFLENIIDPNAVIGTDFQPTTLELKSGDVVSGLLLQETASALTLRTATEQRVVAKSEVSERSMGSLSLMPEGLLESLGEREQIELLKYLAEH